MRDRYSIIVGLLFLAVIVVATIHTLSGGGGGETLGLDQLPPRWPLPEFAVPAGAGAARRRRQRRPGRLRNAPRCPARTTPAATPACRIDTAGAIRVCDLFDRPLVISFWFTKGGGLRRPAGRGRAASTGATVDGWASSRWTSATTATRVRELIRQHGWTMPVGYDRDGAVASLYRVGGCPTFAYVYPGGTLQSASIGDLTAAQLSDRVERLLRGHRGGGRELRWPPTPPSRGWAGTRRREQGWVAPHIAAEFPGLGIAWVEVDAKPGQAARSRSGGACATSPTASTAPRRSTCANGRSPGPTASSSARSASTPTAPARRSSSSPSTASTTAASAATGLPADALDDRDRRDRGRAARLRRRPARGRPLHPRLGAGRVAAGQARRAGAGDADDRRRDRARSGCSSAPTAEGAGSSASSRRIAIAASRSRACRRSPSTRRSGWPRATSA